MAMLKLENNPEWKRIGGRLLVPVHDELICEVPMEEYEKGAEILSNCMCEAGNFLPFPITCDVETTLRWYGLSYPCPYPQPTNIHNLSVEEIKWVQYHLVECEYHLPIYKDENGDKPKGDAAKGVNGVNSEELNNCIKDYINRYNIQPSEFINHIHNKVYKGE